MAKPKTSIRKPPPQAADSFVSGQTAKSPTVQTARRPSRRKRKQVTVYLPDDLVKKLKLQSIEQEKEMSEIAEDALTAHLAS